MSDLKVKFAVWGASVNGDPLNDRAGDISGRLQDLIERTGGKVQFTTGNFDDTCLGYGKHFAGIVIRNNKEHYFACAENQTIDFNYGGTPT